MNHWLPKKKLLNVSLLVWFLALVGYGVGVYLVNSKIDQIERAFSETESAVAQEERARVLSAIADQNKTEIKILRNFFVMVGDEVGFIEKIEEVARVSGVDFEIDSIAQAKVDPGSVKEDINLKINIEGSWREAMTFISKLEKMSFGVSIRNIDLDSRSKGLWSGFVEF